MQLELFNRIYSDYYMAHNGGRPPKPVSKVSFSRIKSELSRSANISIDQLGVYWTIEYFGYRFWKSLEKGYPPKRSDLFTNKAIKNWFSATTENLAKMRWSGRSHGRSLNIYPDRYIEQEQYNYRILHFKDEVIKEQLHNKEGGLMHCYRKTFMFHPQSPLCQLCDKKLECRSLLKSTYPLISAVREDLINNDKKLSTFYN